MPDTPSVSPGALRHARTFLSAYFQPPTLHEDLSHIVLDARSCFLDQQAHLRHKLAVMKESHAPHRERVEHTLDLIRLILRQPDDASFVAQINLQAENLSAAKADLQKL